MATKDPDREARLAQALRANLKRRKAQARDRARTGPATPDAPEKPVEPEPPVR